MGPKVKPSIKFANSKVNKKFIITFFNKLKESLEGNKYIIHIEN